VAESRRIVEEAQKKQGPFKLEEPEDDEPWRAPPSA